MNIEPSRQNWIKDAAHSRIYGTREQMEARIASAFAGWRYAELSYAPTMAAMLAHHYGVAVAHWGLALMELEAQGVAQ